MDLFLFKLWIDTGGDMVSLTPNFNTANTNSALVQTFVLASHWHDCHCIWITVIILIRLPICSFFCVYTRPSSHLHVLRQCLDIHPDGRAIEERKDHRTGQQGEDRGLQFQATQPINS